MANVQMLMVLNSHDYGKVNIDIMMVLIIPYIDSPQLYYSRLQVYHYCTCVKEAMVALLFIVMGI